ncbi:MAG: DUF72 domain-containing protein [Gammaproteobacteria bacterium]
MSYYLGCPLWGNPAWVGGLFKRGARPQEFLAQYAEVFSTVEGNTTFYALPRADTVLRWREATPDHFRFCCKFPRTISHDASLRHVDRETVDFLDRLSLLENRLGPFFLQLPPQFGPENLAVLWDYLAKLPVDFDYAVEVRHLDFFAKGDSEKAFNRGLYERGIDRVILDSRALFSARAEDADTREAQRKKPRLPVRAVALGKRPLVRFIGHPEVLANQDFLRPWQDKLAAWINEGRTPYFFAHTPNNHQAPEVARAYHELLRERISGLSPLAAWPAESTTAQLSLL